MTYTRTIIKVERQRGKKEAAESVPVVIKQSIRRIKGKVYVHYISAKSSIGISAVINKNCYRVHFTIKFQDWQNSFGHQIVSNSLDIEQRTVEISVCF